MKNNRIYPLLKKLSNETEFVPIRTLADHLGVSYATARSDLQKLERILPPNTGVERKQGQGVRLYGAPDQISKLKTGLFGEDVSNYNTPENRILYICLRLLLAQKPVRVRELRQELFVSGSTIQTDLCEVEKIFYHYKIQISRKQNSPFRIIGTERRIRNCAIELLRRDPCVKDLIDLLVGHSTLDKDVFPIPYLPLNVASIQELIEAYLSNPTSYWHSIPLRASVSIFIALLITCYRATQGCKLELSEEFVAYMTKQPLYEEVQAILDALNRKIGIHLPETDLRFLQIHLLAQQSDLSVANKEQVEALYYAKKIIREWSRTFALDLHTAYLENILGDYLRSALIRIRHGLPLPNSSIQIVRTQYPKLFERSVHCIEKATKELDLEIPPIEGGGLTLFLLAALEKEQKRLRTLLVCHVDRGAQELLKTRIQSHIAEIEIKQSCRYVDFARMTLTDIDLIVSTLPLYVEREKPIYIIPPYVEEADLIQLRGLAMRLEKEKFRKRFQQ